MMEAAKHILDIREASFGYKQGTRETVLLRDTSLQLRRGELTGLIGRNGSGKSTLLRSIMKLNNHLDGRILLNGRDINQIQNAEMARICGFVPTGLVNAGMMTVRELVELGRYPYTNWYGKLTADDDRAVEEAIFSVGLENMANRLITEVSDGEKQRAMIARTLAQQTELILLDEPSAFLDIPNKFEITTLLRQLCDSNHAVIFSTHDLNLALHYADKIWLIEDDHVIQGAPEDLIIQGKIEQLFISAKVAFDKISAGFRPHVSYRGNILVTGGDVPAHLFAWTRKALERKGFKTVSGKDKSDLRLEIRYENGQNVWILQKDDKNLLFETLYDLTLHLNLDNHEFS